MKSNFYAFILIQLNTSLYIVKSQRNSFPKRISKGERTTFKQANYLFNTFEDPSPLQISNSTQRKLSLLASLQKKYLYTCKNIATKLKLDEFLRKLFEQ